MRTFSVCMLALCGCGHPATVTPTEVPPADVPPAPESGLAWQGDFPLEVVPERSIEVREGVLWVWGVTEVPGGSRMQAAFAMVDAITRAELVKYLRVRVESLATDETVADGAQITQRLLLQTSEVAGAAVPATRQVQRVSRTVDRDGSPWIQIVGRLEVRRDELRGAWTRVLGTEDAGALKVVEGVFRP